MKKITNWVFGSFFRTLGRVLVYILIGYLLSCLLKDLKLPSLISILEVEALQVGGVEYYTPSELELYNNTGLNSTTRVNSNWLQPTGYGPTYKRGYVSTTTSGYGASWCFNTGATLLANYIYTAQMIVQNGSGLGFTTVSNDNYDMLRIGYSLDDASLHSNSTNIVYFGVTYDSNGVYVNDYQLVNSAYVMTFLFNTKINANYICLPFRHLQNTSNDDEVFYGAKIDVIGQNNLVTNDSLNNAITNSGLASATSVTQVQNSINQVQEEIQNTQSAIDNQTQQQQQQHEETMDTITDDTGPSNIDSLGDAAGWLPAGPVDGILNLPLSFLTNLNTNLSKSCQSVNLPLPFIDKTLPLPCVSSLYAEIEGLPSWINTIGIIASAFILFGYLINLYKYIDDTLTFRENNYIDNWSGV